MLFSDISSLKSLITSNLLNSDIENYLNNSPPLKEPLDGFLDLSKSRKIDSEVNNDETGKDIDTKDNVCL